MFLQVYVHLIFHSVLDTRYYWNEKHVLRDSQSCQINNLLVFWGLFVCLFSTQVKHDSTSRHSLKAFFRVYSWAFCAFTAEMYNDFWYLLSESKLNRMNKDPGIWPLIYIFKVPVYNIFNTAKNTCIVI